MPHPVYGVPDHKLERVRFTLHLPLPHNENVTSLTVLGESSTARTSLWSVSESWTAEEQCAGLQPADAVHHLALIALQDRPRSQEALFGLLTGWEKGVQLDLFDDWGQAL